MARSDVLVSADWAEQNLDTPGVVFVEVDEDTEAYDMSALRSLYDFGELKGGDAGGAGEVTRATAVGDVLAAVREGRLRLPRCRRRGRGSSRAARRSRRTWWISAS